MNARTLSGSFSITATIRRVGFANVRPVLRFAITLVTFFIAPATAFAQQPLSTTVIRDSSVYTSTDFFDVYKDYLGQPVTQQTSTSIAEAVRERYQRDGYSRPGFRILEDGTASGIIRIRLVEPSISGISISGNAGPYRSEIDALFADLPSAGSMRPAEIRDVLRRANRMPGLDVKLSTSPDETRNGGFVLEVDSDYRSFEGVTTISNRGTREIGRNILFGRLTYNGLLGGENAAGLFGATAEDSRNYRSGGGYLSLTHGASGLATTLQASTTAIEIVTSGILVNQDREQFRLKLRYPLPFDSGLRATAWGTLEMDDLDMRQDGTPSREDRLRSVGGGLSLSWRGEARQQLVSLEVELGLNDFGARLDNLFNPDDPRDHDYAITELHYVNLTTLNARWSLRFDLLGQYSPQYLPSVKQFKVGGGRIGRGFEAAALRGDRGVGSKLQLGRKLEGRAWILQRAETYAFFDQGSAWRYGVAGRESASSAGVGYSMRGEHVGARLELAKPLTHDDADGRRDASLFFEVSARF